MSYPNIIEIPRNCAGNHGVSTFQSCEPLPSFLSYQFWKNIFQVSPFKHFSLRSTTCRGRNVDQLPTMEIYKGQELKQRWSGANTKKLQPQHPMIGTSGSSGGAVPKKRSYFLGDSMIFPLYMVPPINRFLKWRPDAQCTDTQSSCVDLVKWQILTGYTGSISKRWNSTLASVKTNTDSKKNSGGKWFSWAKRHCAVSWSISGLCRAPFTTSSCLEVQGAFGERNRWRRLEVAASS